MNAKYEANFRMNLHYNCSFSQINFSSGLVNTLISTAFSSFPLFSFLCRCRFQYVPFSIWVISQLKHPTHILNGFWWIINMDTHPFSISPQFIREKLPKFALVKYYYWRPFVHRLWGFCHFFYNFIYDPFLCALLLVRCRFIKRLLILFSIGIW